MYTIKIQGFIGMWVYVRVFSLIPLIYVFIFMPVPNCLHYYRSIVELEVRHGDTSRSSFIVQYYFSYPGFFVSLFFHMMLSIVLSRSGRIVRILMGMGIDCIESVDCFQ